MLVVLGIVSILIGLVLPVVSLARHQARTTGCGSNLRQIGVAMHAYAHQWKGVVTPRWGFEAVQDHRHFWPRRFIGDDFEKVGRCPVWAMHDEVFSYTANRHVDSRNIRLGFPGFPNMPTSEIVLVGEHRWGSKVHGHLLGLNFFLQDVDPEKHGRRDGAHQLYFDGHVREVVDPQPRFFQPRPPDPENDGSPWNLPFRPLSQIRR